jgi:hypothetical protein
MADRAVADLAALEKLPVVYVASVLLSDVERRGCMNKVVPLDAIQAESRAGVIDKGKCDSGAYSEKTNRAKKRPALPNVQGAISLEDIYAYMPTHSFIYVPSREMWSASSIDARILPIPAPDRVDAGGKPIKGESLKASKWLASNRPVEQMTWAPGEPLLIENRLISDGGWIVHRGVRCFNLYRPPNLKPGDASKAKPWTDHVRRVYLTDAEHIFNWLAQRLQHPDQKINHALVLGGSQGIGKDTLLARPIRESGVLWPD